MLGMVKFIIELSFVLTLSLPRLLSLFHITSLSLPPEILKFEMNK